jgi:hypothetical protein
VEARAVLTRQRPRSLSTEPLMSPRMLRGETA